MQSTLAIAALLMGVAGAPHCAAMCGAACGGVLQARGRPTTRSMLQFQLGRLAAYAGAGAIAGLAMESLAWLSSHAAALRPLWMLMHLAVLAWGLTLATLARQPAWVAPAGRAVWSRVRPLAQARGGLVAAGALWVFMPCGLLYSALLVAALSGGALEGGLSMALFALGSGAGMGAFPLLLGRVRRAGGRWPVRAGGVLLAAAAAWALWMDLAHRLPEWCLPG
jgi:sulfite exporter TauE/SafE